MTRELTGRHVLFIMLGFFGVIITVNLFMASKAIGTFSGVEAQNTYYASQNFDRNRKAQQALGWQVSDRYQDGRLALRVTAADGLPADVADLQVLVGRSTVRDQDVSPVFIREGGEFIAPLTLAPGKWLLRLEARAPDGTLFRQNRQLFVKG